MVRTGKCTFKGSKNFYLNFWCDYGKILIKKFSNLGTLIVAKIQQQFLKINNKKSIF